MVNIQVAVLEHKLGPGNKIRSCFQIESERYVILVDRGDKFDADRYVIAGYRCGDTEWDCGQYVDDIYQASAAFLNRCQAHISFCQD